MKMGCLACNLVAKSWQRVHELARQLIDRRAPLGCRRSHLDGATLRASPALLARPPGLNRLRARILLTVQDIVLLEVVQAHRPAARVRSS